MSTLVNWNGQQYLVPAYNDTGYAQGNGNLSQYLVALSTGSLQQVGGLFQLTADADFGPNFGLVSSYYKSRTANIASAGVLRLANTDAIKWRNSDNSADVTLAMNATGTAARTYTIPDLATSSFVMTEGAQTINGVKTFGSAIVGSLTGAASLNLLLTGGTLTGALVAAVGSVGAPGISFAGDLATGFYRPSANQVAIVTNGGTSALFLPSEVDFYLSNVVKLTLAAATATLSLPLAMSANKITGLAAGSANGDALRYEQLIGQYLPLGGGVLTGTVTNSGQPSFIATNSNITDVTGDGTSYTVAFGTEIADRGSNYNNSTYTFTAPITGLYQVNAIVRFQNVTALVTYVQVVLNASNRTFTNTVFLPLAASTIWSVPVSALVDMDSGDTVTVLAEAGGTTKTIDIQSGGHFSAFLVA
jgi:hypothetical protein